ncbi:MAG: ATP-dependent Clp protease ATP-binding subunit [Rhodothermales bacterium]
MSEFATSALLAWKRAAHEVLVTRRAGIEPAHLLMALCRLSRAAHDYETDDQAAHRALKHAVRHVYRRFDLADLDPEVMHQQLRRRLTPAETPAAPDTTIHRTNAAKQVFAHARTLVPEGVPMEAVHLLGALLDQPDPLFADLIEIDPEARATTKAPSRMTSLKPAPRHATAATLYGRDLTAAARLDELTPYIGNERMLRRLARMLLQQRRRNVLLTGSPGVGKTALVEGLAQWAASDRAPEVVRAWRIIEVEWAKLTAGPLYKGELESRLKQVLDAASPETVLFFDEIHAFAEAKGEQSSLATVLKTALDDGNLRCIGATTTREYRKHLEPEAALARRFDILPVEEPSRDEAVAILEHLRPRFERQHGLAIAPDALSSAVDLSIRYIRDRFLPDKALALLDQACARTLLGSVDLDAVDDLVVDRSEVMQVLQARYDIPLAQLTSEEAGRLLQLADRLGERVKGQNAALHTVAEAVQAAQAGLRDPNRPRAVFLFVGATGTGKTELAKALANDLFGSEDRLLRLDMSEFMEKHTVSRLLGAPPGYVGHGEDGHLTGPIRTHPYQVVLFDEIEKAHPDVLNLLLQLLDDGRLTDSQGRTASFREAIVILTSNLGSRVATEAKRSLGFAAETAPSDAFDRAAYTAQIDAALQAHLRPELLNRIPHRVVFRPLDRAAIRAIIDRLVAQTEARLAERKLTLDLVGEAYDLLMREGYDVRYGARAMQRTFDRFVTQPLARLILEQRVTNGATVQVTAEADRLQLEVE